MQSQPKQIPQQLEFNSADLTYVYVDRHVVACQSVLMELQRQITAATTTFLNSKFRRRVRYRWVYLQRLCDLCLDVETRPRLAVTNDPKKVAQNLASVYRLLRAAVVHESDNGIVRDAIVPTAFDSMETQIEPFRTLSRIHQLFSRLQDSGTVLGSYAHGSMGSQDFNDYSDIDLLLIVTADAACQAAELLRCRDAVGKVCREIYCYDVLQHHGVFIASEIDLGFYPEAYLPITVLQNALAFCGAQQLTLRVRDSHFDAIRSYQTTTAYLRHWSRNIRRLSNLDRIKGFNSNLLLLPCLYLETRGEFCYKRESFEIIEPLLSDVARTSLRVASDVRDRWTRAGINFAMERVLIRTGLLAQYLIRAGFARTIDRLFVSPYARSYDALFWSSLQVLLDELDNTYGAPLSNQ